MADPARALTLHGGPLDGATVEVLVDLGRYAEFILDPPEDWPGVDQHGNIGTFVRDTPLEVPPLAHLRTAVYRWEKRKARRLGVVLQWEVLVSDDVKRNRLAVPPK